MDLRGQRPLGHLWLAEKDNARTQNHGLWYGNVGGDRTGGREEEGGKTKKAIQPDRHRGVWAGGVLRQCPQKVCDER